MVAEDRLNNPPSFRSGVLWPEKAVLCLWSSQQTTEKSPSLRGRFLQWGRRPEPFPGRSGQPPTDILDVNLSYNEELVVKKRGELRGQFVRSESRLDEVDQRQMVPVGQNVHAIEQITLEGWNVDALVKPIDEVAIDTVAFIYAHQCFPARDFQLR